MISVSSAKRILIRKGENCMVGWRVVNTCLTFFVALHFIHRSCWPGEFWPVLCSIKPERAVVCSQATIPFFPMPQITWVQEHRQGQILTSGSALSLNTEPNDRWSQTWHSFQKLNSRKVTQCLFPYTVITTSGSTDKAIMHSSEIRRPWVKGMQIRTFQN